MGFAVDSMKGIRIFGLLLDVGFPFMPINAKANCGLASAVSGDLRSPLAKNKRNGIK